MLTSESVTQAVGAPPAANFRQLPSEFEGVKAVRMNDHELLKVITKPELRAQWFPRPRSTEGFNPVDQEYINGTQRGWIKAKPEHILSCKIPFNDQAQAYLYGDVILMVNAREQVLGLQRGMYEDSAARLGIYFDNLENQNAEMQRRGRAAGADVAALNTTAELELKTENVSIGKKK